jgi:hypothetical protein
MAMHNPSHPGEFTIQVYLDPNNLSGSELAGKLGVAASTLNRILTGASPSVLKWRYAFPRRLAVLRRVGLPCSTTTISGKPSSM